jgi:predicted ATPase
VCELEGAGERRTRLQLGRELGLSRLVGRADEMAALTAALGRALAGNGQVVGIVGEPGVGKSRLCYEFGKLCRGRGLVVEEAHCLAHGKGIPFLPVLELLRGFLGWDAGAAPIAREEMVRRLLDLDGDLEDVVPLLLDFVDVPNPELARLDPEARQAQLFVALRRLTHARTRREPMVTIVEDLHRIDGASDAFLEAYF